MLSDLFKLDWKDVINSAVLAGLIAIVGPLIGWLTGIQAVLATGQLPTLPDSHAIVANIGNWLLVGLMAAVMNIVRKIFTGPANTFLNIGAKPTEPPTP